MSNDDCVAAITRMRQMALSPDQSQQQRDNEHVQLQAWGHEQSLLFERLRDDENRHAVFPLQQSLAIVNRYLGDLLDQTKMVNDAGGLLLRVDPQVSVYANKNITANSEPQLMDVNLTLDLVAQCSSNGKRKVRDEVFVSVSGDGKCMRQMGPEAGNRTPAECVALQAECARLHVYLGPLIDIRSHLLEFCLRAFTLAHCRQYVINFNSSEESRSARIPFLKWEEQAQLEVLWGTFERHGQFFVVNVIKKIQELRFRDEQVIAQLLRFDILSLEEHGLPGEGPITREDSFYSAASAFERACYAQCYLSLKANPINRQMTPPGPHVPGPLFHTLPVPNWITNTSRGRAFGSLSLVGCAHQRDHSSGHTTSVHVYNNYGHYLPLPAVSSLIPIHVLSRSRD